jgi:4-amino-4-deoxy-L-arabinose transferase-like glycosyltransferase
MGKRVLGASTLHPFNEMRCTDTSLRETQRMSRGQGLLIVVLVWAAIYLPGLGSLEIKGEEGRRILPAITMLETGNYIVPQVGGEQYFSKPPLVNWLVAASFKIFGVRNEWTARLPSALCVLAVTIAFITIARRSLGAPGSTIAALIWLTNFGIIEKGRSIEIEALYVSLFALAFICWLSWWEQERSPWLTWTVPWIFLGLGWLAKAPIHVIFFYAIVIAVLWRSRELRRICNLPHLFGIIIMMAIFAAWAIPAKMEGGAEMTRTWQGQIWLALADFKLRGWITNIPRSLGYFLPWLLFLPLVSGARFSSARQIDIMRGLLWGIGLPLLIVDLIPGWLPRYGMPLVAPATWLLAATLTAEDLQWPRWLGGKKFLPQDRQRTVALIVILTGICISIYAFLIVPHLQKKQKVKAIAAQIDALVPASQRLYAVDPDFQPFLFYVRAPLVYIRRIEDVPREARYFLVQSENEGAAKAAQQWLPLHPERVLLVEDYRHWKTSLFAIKTP